MGLLQTLLFLGLRQLADQISGYILLLASEYTNWPGRGPRESNPVSPGYEPEMVFPFHSPAMSGVFFLSLAVYHALQG